MVIILCEIRCFWFHRDTLARIVGKPAAFGHGGAQTLFAAQDLLIVDFGAVFTVRTGSLDLLTKKHGRYPFSANLAVLYRIDEKNAITFLKKTVIIDTIAITRKEIMVLC